MKNQTTTTQPQTYLGWANYETWNVALWMQNNQFLYNTAVACVEFKADDEMPYTKFIRNMHNIDKFTTNDGVAWDDENVNHDEINEMMFASHSDRDEFTSLIDKCLNVAEQMAHEINGDLFYVPEEEIQQCLDFLTEDNLHEVASQIAQLAHSYN